MTHEGNIPLNEIILYQPDNAVKLEVRLENETVWLTQAQMAELFQRDQSVISRHINNVFKEKELIEESNMHFCILLMRTIGGGSAGGGGMNEAKATSAPTTLNTRRPNAAKY
ncbi:hypothetical protein FACS1894109_11280 [Spirochaetia bacterium]|nr:hypothetical protein FACS1894109_11280 [Spirochaetia bacterium]